MIRIFFTSLLLISANVSAMKKANMRTSPKATELQKAQMFADQAVKEALFSFKQDSNPHKYLRKAGVCAQLALQLHQADPIGQLAAIEHFDKAVQAFDKNDCNEVATHCVSILNGDHSSLLLDRIRVESFNLLKVLGDKKHHTPSRFYVMKRYLSSKDQVSIQEGLDRYDALDTTHMPYEDVKGLSAFFEYFDIISDLERIAIEQKNPQAQCALAESHLFQAERGENMQGVAVDVKKELSEALALAKCAKKMGYSKAIPLIKKIRESSQALYEDAKIDAPLTVLDPTRSIPKEMKDALDLLRIAYTNDRGQLYAHGKKLVNDPSIEVCAIGQSFLKDAVRLDHPFAACLLADTLILKDSQKAFWYYHKALHLFKSALSNSYTHMLGKFAIPSLERHIHHLVDQSETKDPYLYAASIAQNVLFQKELMKEGASTDQAFHEATEYVLFNVDCIAQALHECEDRFVQTQSTVDTLELEMLVNSGVLAYLDHLREYPGIQAVLIEALSLRGKLGRGYLLKDKNPNAHLEKALHFIIDPNLAGKVSLETSVSRDVLSRKIAIDTLPQQQRILYMHNMLTLIERMLVKEDSLTKDEAQFACTLFNLCSQALEQTKDVHLKQSFGLMYSSALSHMASIAIKSELADSMKQVGLILSTLCTSGPFSMKHMQDAQKLYTALIELESKKVEQESQKSDVGSKKKQGALLSLKKKLSALKRIEAELACEMGNRPVACQLYSEALALFPEDTTLLWQFAQVLLTSDDVELRKEGFGYILLLADTHKHHDALKYVARGYCSGSCEFIKLDGEKAIKYLQLVVAQDKHGAPGSRGSLAACYLNKAKTLSDFPRQRLVAKAHDLVKDFKRYNHEFHMLYLDILLEMKRSKEILHEINEYGKEQVTDQQVYQVVAEYLKRVSDVDDALRMPLLRKAVQLTEHRAISSENAYVLLIKSLFALGDHALLVEKLKMPSAPYLGALKKSLEAAVFVMKHKEKQFEIFETMSEQAFELYNEYYQQKPVLDTLDLVALIQAGGGQVLPLTNPWHKETFLELRGVQDVLEQLLVFGAIQEPEGRVLVQAYRDYFAVKINMIRLGMHWADDQAVIDALIKAVNSADNVSSMTFKHKLLDQLNKYITLCITKHPKQVMVASIIRIPQLLKLADKLCLASKEGILSQPFCDIVERVDAALIAVPLDELSQKDKTKIGIVQKIVAQYK